MTLHRRLFTTVGGVVAILVLLVSVISKTIILDSNTALEDQLLNLDLARVLGVVRLNLATLDAFGENWASTDDIRTLAHQSGQTAASLTQVDRLANQFKPSLVALLKPDGQIAFGRLKPPSGRVAGLTFDACLDHVMPGSPLGTPPPGGTCGIICVADTPMLVSSRPVLSPDGTGTPGALVLGRFLDLAEMKQLTDTIHMPLFIDMLAPAERDTAMPAGTEGLDHVLESVELERLGADTLRGKLTLVDVYGHPVARLCVDATRELHQQGMATVWYLFSWLLVTGVAISMAVFWVLSKRVLLPLSRSTAQLRQGLAAIAEKKSLSSRLDSGSPDEFSELTRAANDMLAQLEAAKREADETHLEIIQAHKMVSLGLLVSGLAHEVNNPNTVIMLNASSLEDIYQRLLPVLDEYSRQHPEFRVGPRLYTEIREQIPAMLREMNEASSRIAALVDDMKNFAKPDVGTVLERVDVNAVIRSSVTLIGNHAQRLGNVLELDLAAAIPPVQGRLRRLEQVFVNLIQNACQACESGGKTVRVTTQWTAGSGYVKVTVSDNGPGVRPEDLPRLTEPFFTTRHDRGGTGLGLSISDRIVREHGGTLTFESQPGNGTVVTVTLPVQAKY